MNWHRRKLLKYSAYALGMLNLSIQQAQSMKNDQLLLSGTPKQDGFYFPGEWYPHEYTIMQFVTPQNWSGFGLADARQDWATVANTVSEFEPVLMVVDPRDRTIAQKLLNSEIELVEFPLNDGWSRDSAPMFLIDDQGNRRVAGFTFNGWGAKFPPYDDDALLSHRLCQYLDIPYYRAGMVCEGGAVTLDGEGTLITTEECLLNPNRNPNLTKAQIETILENHFNVNQVIWLKRGTTPDPITDGHVDGICVYVAPGVVMLQTTDDESDPNYQICQDAQERLTRAADGRGRKLEIIELPLGWDVSHINFYLANDSVIVPIANDPEQDDEPMSIIRDTFPERKVVGVKGNILAKGGGGVHCITQQVPVMK